MSNIIDPPKEFPQPTLIASSFDCYVDSVILGVQASIRVILKDSTGTAIKIELLTMSGDAYLAWGSNDDYVNEWVREQLGLPPLPLE